MKSLTILLASMTILVAAVSSQEAVEMKEIPAAPEPQAAGNEFGENLAAGHRDFLAAIDAWYNEVWKYNYNNLGFGYSGKS
ncbi:hypothetical protein BG011_007571 [Mortierella polycephala]|uniref:Uncharacterized protein n=1 Tax=Mortierella polycephala TaxID=41804 RepID=A0A9P6QEX8_9FUNG|nr:hypothetical protein BG011_007571 [Mortierella polycephala]